MLQYGGCYVTTTTKKSALFLRKESDFAKKNFITFSKFNLFCLENVASLCLSLIS